MNIITELSSSKGERGEAANIALAKKIAAASDQSAVKELIQLCETAKVAVQNDAIKVLYEIGAEKPGLIAGATSAFVALLESKNNRMQWGAMTALDAIAGFKADAVAKLLPAIVEAAKKGSVITKDHAVGILAKLSASKKYSIKALPLLLAELKIAAPNQFAMYAEMSAPSIPAKSLKVFVELLKARMKKLPKASQQKRIEKLLRKITPTQ